MFGVHYILMRRACLNLFKLAKFRVQDVTFCISSVNCPKTLIIVEAMEEFEKKSVDDVMAWLEDKGFDEGVQRAFAR